jgi:hypothetical protein
MIHSNQTPAASVPSTDRTMKSDRDTRSANRGFHAHGGSGILPGMRPEGNKNMKESI